MLKFIHIISLNGNLKNNSSSSTAECDLLAVYSKLFSSCVFEFVQNSPFSSPFVFVYFSSLFTALFDHMLFLSIVLILHSSYLMYSNDLILQSNSLLWFTTLTIMYYLLFHRQIENSLILYIQISDWHVCS